ncbi:hypothetical protein [Streptomyces sp. WM4235]|uniref:hypothetical protein n=1 Tax=Streptomyces sp. WM4235 TaxID=1415551 RepID=UPI003B634F4E
MASVKVDVNGGGLTAAITAGRRQGPRPQGGLSCRSRRMSGASSEKFRSPACRAGRRVCGWTADPWWDPGRGERVGATGIVGVGCCIGSAGAAARRQSPAHQSPARGPWRPAASGSLPARGDKRSQEQCLRPCASSGTG